jgi:transposase
VSYQEIQKRLGGAISFIAKSQKKYRERGVAGLKLGYQGSKSYLTAE